MSRIVSVWLPRWPILRALAAQAKTATANPSATPVTPDRPFVLAAAAAGSPRIAALNAAAETAGLAVGDPLADARAKVGDLQVRPVDAAADAAALRRLALWATRYTPTAAPWGEDSGADGFFLDIEGAAHLFGGEESLLGDLHARLAAFDLPARLAVAATPGAAWALAHFTAAPCCVLGPGGEAAALAPLPIEALRLTPDTCRALRRLGLKSVGALIDTPRAPLAARFPRDLLRRLDQALGRLDEPLRPVIAPPVYHCLRYLPEPIITQNAIVALASRLMQTLAQVLTRDDVGARGLRLSLYGVAGTVETVDIALTLPTRSAAHVARLIDLRLDALASAQDAGFGFEAIGLAITRAERMTARQTEFIDTGTGRRCGPNAAEALPDANGEGCAALIDILRQRLGPGSVRHFAAVASHIPERAEMVAPFHEQPQQWPEAETNSRPLLLLSQAEPAEVMALVPDGPPRRFCWRGTTYEIAGAQGPERIAAEWWRTLAPNLSAPEAKEEDLTRDYYLVEDAGGRRFWLFREGLYGRETPAARWFVHGLFA
jgi:protein ImuB